VRLEAPARSLKHLEAARVGVVRTAACADTRVALSVSGKDRIDRRCSSEINAGVTSRATHPTRRPRGWGCRGVQLVADTNQIVLEVRQMLHHPVVELQLLNSLEDVGVQLLP